MNATTTEQVLFYYNDGEEIQQEWNPAFVVFAFGIAFVSSYMAVHLLDHDLWRTDEEKECAIIKYPRSMAAFILGFGTVWCMHFVGMGAVTLDHTPMCFDWVKTMGSLAASVIFMFIAVMVASTDIFATQDRVQVLKQVILERRNGTVRRSSRDRKKNRKKNMREIFFVLSLQQLHPLIIAAIVSATGALVMHYTGMMAMHGPFHKEWNLFVVMASAVTAVIVCFVGFWIIFRLRWKVKDMWPRVLSAAIIATGVCCLHFMGMIGVKYVADSTVNDTCSKTIETSEKSPNAWSTHQTLVVAIGILVPTIGVIVENAINQELLLVYGKKKDKEFDLLINPTGRSSNKSTSNVKMSSNNNGDLEVLGACTHSVCQSDGISQSVLVESADNQEDDLFEEIAIELRGRLSRNDKKTGDEEMATENTSA